jgi:hypothetical protein
MRWCTMDGMMAILPTPPASNSLKGGVITTRWCTKGRLQLHCIVGFIFCGSQGLKILWGRLDCRCRPSPGPGSDSEVKTDKSECFSADCGLGPRRKWNSAWESLCKFVSPELFQRINAIRKGVDAVNRVVRSIHCIRS